MTDQPPIERPWDPPKPEPKQPMSKRTKWIIGGGIGVVIALIIFNNVSGQLSNKSPAVAACQELSAAGVAEFNFTLDAYENGESITSGKLIPVNMEGAGTLPYVAMIAAKLNKAGTVALWAQGKGGFIIPLNSSAFMAMPEAAAEGDVSKWANSPEGQATIKCVK